MSVINTENLTLLDLAKRKDPNGAVAAIVEVMTRRNPIIQDAVFKEGNLETGDLITTRTGLPSIGWRRFNEGVTAGKSKTDQITETCGMMTGTSKLDVALANIGGNAGAKRASEDKAFVQSFNNELETGLIYHSTKSAPEKIHGIIPRLNATTDPGGSQIILCDAAPSGADQTSILFVGWGDESVYGIIPKGSNAGLKSKDLGERMVDDGTGKEYLAFQTYWEWFVGLAVKDWRYVARVANIDTSALSATADTILPAMIKAYYQIENHNAVRGVWYCNRLIATYLHLQARNKVASQLTLETVGGKPVMMFLGAPIRVTDGITNTEAVVA